MILEDHDVESRQLWQLLFQSLPSLDPDSFSIIKRQLT
jgi:hypothetical protein